MFEGASTNAMFATSSSTCAAHTTARMRADRIDIGDNSSAYAPLLRLNLRTKREVTPFCPFIHRHATMDKKGSLPFLSCARYAAATMPRPPRIIQAGACYHVLNRGNGRARIFHKPADFDAFVTILADGLKRYDITLLAWCLMPN